MQLKFIILFLCILAGTCFGFTLSKKYRTGEKYFEALLNLTNYLMSGISFQKQNIKQLMEGFVQNSKNTKLNSQLTEYVYSLEKCDKYIVANAGFLNKGQADCITNFFSNIGKSDSETQIFELKNFKDRFNEFYQDAVKGNKKYGSLYIKLGLLAGAAVGILMM